MSTKNDVDLGRGHDAEWLGSLKWECEPENLLRVPPGRLALTATDEPTYRAAVANLFIVWETEELARPTRAEPGGRGRGRPATWPVGSSPSTPPLPACSSRSAAECAGNRLTHVTAATRRGHRPPGHQGVAARTPRPALGPAPAHARPRYRASHRRRTVPHQPVGTWEAVDARWPHAVSTVNALATELCGFPRDTASRTRPALPPGPASRIRGREIREGETRSRHLLVWNRRVEFYRARACLARAR